jgi:hypothetical protein
MKEFTVYKTKGYTIQQIKNVIQDGGKFITYGYCISLFAFTLRLTSSSYLITSNEDIRKYKGKYNIISFILGWWGLPYGPIYTIDMIKMNNKGGADVTDVILPKLLSQNPKHFVILEEDALVTFYEDELVSSRD